MKILCLTPWFPSHSNDQQGNYILDSLEAIRALGHEQQVWLITPWKPCRTPCEKFTAGFDVKTVRYCSLPRHYLRAVSNWLYLKRLIPLLEKEIRKNRPDVIHAHTELYALAANRVGKKYGIPTVVTIHGLETSARYWKGSKKAIIQALQQVNRVVLVGEPLRDFFKALVGHDEHFQVVYNGFRSCDALRDTMSASWSSPLKLVSVSNLHEGKGIDLNLSALAILIKEGFDDWHYTIIGDGKEKEKLVALVKALNLTDKVTFKGACAHDHVYQHLMASNVFSLPSYREAFGIAYIEAMAAGLLTIGVEGQGPSAFITPAKTGLLVQPNDVNSLAETLKSIFNHKLAMQTIANQGRAVVWQCFTWASHARAMTAVYHQLSAEKHHVAHIN